MKKKRILLGLGAFAFLGLATVLASCDAKKFTVKFYDGETELTDLTETVANGYNVTVPTAPTKDGKSFNGWYKDAALTEAYDFGSIVSGDLSIYARWENEYAVTFKNGDQTVATQTVINGDVAKAPATAPTKASDANYDYVFVAWCSDKDLLNEFDFARTNITAPTTVYAKFAAVSKDTAIKMNGTEYATIKEAIAAVPTDSTETFTITVPKGTYTENGLAYNGKATIVIKGNTATKYGADVIIKGHGSDMTQEKTRNLISVQGSGNIILENLTLLSDWTRNGAAAEGKASNTQAEVLGTDTTGKTVAYNCSFKSHQDTLRTAGKAWFYGCYIEGDTDFIWMEQAGSVALYENCEIVSVYDEEASTHASYVTAPRMAVSSKAGKGLVIFNSTVKESAEAKQKGQQTYLARSPWTSGYFSQVAYINTTCTDVEEDVWYKNPIPSEYDRTVVGWKMDKATAATLGYKGTDILDDATVANEFSGRRTILNRLFNGGKLKYEKDSEVWDIDALIKANGWLTTKDSSKVSLDGETAGEPTTYLFDGTVDQSALCDGFAVQSGKTHYVGQNGATITVPVTGKGYVEVYGYYSGTVEVKGGEQGEAVMFYNNGSTSAQVVNTYAVYDTNVQSVTITAKATTYITKVVVTPDSSVTKTAVSDITVSANTSLECVGVALQLSAKVTPGAATNKSVKWSSSDETVGVVDQYTGAVTFKKEGEVTFTATACDGSGKTGTITCNPVDPNWTQIEWYTTDSKIAEEAGKTEGDVTTGKADGIENFSFGANTAYKSLGKEFTFTNMAGETIKTSAGLKLDSKGELIVATTKGNATLTITIAHIGKIKATPVVKNGSVEATVKTLDDSATTTTYVYELPTAGTWSLTRGDGQSENDPVLYAKVVYETRIVKNTFVNYKGGSYKAETEGAVSLNHNNDQTGSKVLSTDKVTFDNITYEGAKNNNNDNWLKFNAGATIKFTVKGACTLKICSYKGQNLLNVKLGDTVVTTATEATGAGDQTRFVYEITGAGEVTITSTGSGYLGCFEVIYPAA